MVCGFSLLGGRALLNVLETYTVEVADGAQRRGPPSQGWRTFLRNHAMDLFVVPTISFDLLYALVIVRLGRRDLAWINVTANPTAEWVARQITEASPWNRAGHELRRISDKFRKPLDGARALSRFAGGTGLEWRVN